MSDPEQTFGHTVDADEATMEEMRRYAEAARKAAAGASNGAHTVDADEQAMEEMRRFADSARADATRAGGSVPPAASEVTLPVPEVADPPDHTAPTFPPADPVDQLDTIERLPDAPGPVPIPPDLPGRRWQPPPRTVMPVAPQATEATRSPGLWKPAAIVLGLVAAVLAAFLIFGGSSGDEQPGGSTVPGSSVASSVPGAGSVSAGDD